MPTRKKIKRDLQRSTFVRKKSNAGCLSYALLWGAAGATAFVVGEQFESSGVLSLSQMAGVVYAWHFAKAKGWLAAIAVALGMRGLKP
jgi:quinol monooxygenase YgiN